MMYYPLDGVWLRMNFDPGCRRWQFLYPLVNFVPEHTSRRWSWSCAVGLLVNRVWFCEYAVNEFIRCRVPRWLWGLLPLSY